MSKFLNRVRDVDPNDSEAVKEALTAFFQNLPKHKDDDCNRWLRTLENVLNRFPKYCGQHRVNIENYLCHFLDCNNYYNVIEAAKCAHSVQQVRPPQEKTASAKTCWRDHMASLCGAAHSLIDELFQRNSAYSRNTQKSDSHVLSPLSKFLEDIEIVTSSSDVANKRAVLSTRLRNVLIFIQAILVEVYPVAKPVHPQLILEVILHLFSNSGNEDSLTVTTVKIEALRMLDAIVACLGSNLIPYSTLVFRFLMQTLRWSSEVVSADTRKVRCAAYSSLTRWLHCLRTHRDLGDNASWDAELTSHVVADVTPPKHLVQLTPNAQPMKNLSKKARKKLANSLLMQSNIASHMPGEKNKHNMSEESDDDLAIAALECAEAFITTCGIFLKPATHKQFQELLVRECFNLDRYSGSRGCALLRALEACRRSPGPAPPAQYCLQLYSTLAHAASPEISKLATQALLDIRLHLHCSPPSLSFAVEQPAERPDNRKRVSDRNRAVLESLLGQERMPSEDLADEVITIPDEPSNKRPRIDEEADKISLSSASVASVDITDSSSVEEVGNELDDSTDYIIEPNISMAKELERENINNEQEFNVSTETEENDAPVQRIDVTDGKLTDNDDADSKVTQDNQSERQFNIFEAETQIPIVSNDSMEHCSPTKSPLSIEIAYDYPNTGKEKVTVLEKMDEDNLPSTNDTDDVQITCGQTVKISQDDKLMDEETPKENGVENSPEKVTQNGDVENGIEDIDDGKNENAAIKLGPTEVVVTVEDMLADFVDEPIDESPTQISV